MGKPSRRMLVVHAVAMLVVLLVGGQACSKRSQPAAEDQERAPERGGLELAPPDAGDPEPAPSGRAGSAPALTGAASVSRGPEKPPVVAPRAAASGGTARPPAPVRSPGVASVASVAPVAPVASASAAPVASASAAPPRPIEEPDPVEVAQAPQGGVPFHPEGTRYRSPFARPNATSLRVKVGTMINSLDDYDLKTGKFSADLYLSLTSAEPMPKIDLHSVNGVIESQVVLANRPTFKLYRLHGTFKSPADLRKYPFDSQNLRIILEDDTHGTDQVRLVVDNERTKLARGFQAVGWRVNHVEARSLSFTYGERFEGDDLYYGRYILRVGLERHATSAVFTVFVPALVIVLISLLGMWVPPEEMEVRSNAGAPMLAAAVLFHYSLMQELPSTSYFMRADKLMLGVYVALILGMISTWMMFLVHQKYMTLVFRVARVVVPILSVISMILACVLLSPSASPWRQRLSFF